MKIFYLAINLIWAEKSDLAWMKAVFGNISRWFFNSFGISNVILNAALALYWNFSIKIGGNKKIK